MSGSIICSAITAHSPRMGIEKNAPDFTRPVIEGIRKLGDELRQAKPDVVVLMSTHWVTTFPWYVTSHAEHKGVCVADEAPDLIPAIPYHWKGDPALAAAITAEIAAAGIPTGFNDAPDFTLDYGTVVPMQYIDPKMQMTLISLGTCILAPLDECLKVGAAIRRAAEKTGKRIAVVGSTSFAHRIERGPDKWPAKESIDNDAKFIAMLTSGRIGEAKAWLPEYAKAVMAEVGGRVIATIVGSMDESKEGYSGVQHGAYGQSSASGNASVSVRPLH